LCKREKIKEKEVFLFSFSGVWIDREVSNYTSLFPYFRPLPCNQTAPIQTQTLQDIEMTKNLLQAMFSWQHKVQSQEKVGNKSRPPHPL